MFDMLSIEHNYLDIIPVAYNWFMFNYIRSEGPPLFENKIQLTKEFVEILADFIDDRYKKDPTRIIVLDFKNIVLINHSFKIFVDKMYLDNLAFINIDNSISLKEKLKESVCDFVEVCQDDFFKLAKKERTLEAIKEINVEYAYQKYLFNIFKDSGVFSTNVDEVFFLDSSGVFSKTYVHIKNIFSDFKLCTYTIYRISETILNSNIGKIDAFISTSKTGALIATLVGKILGIKVIHCISTGPKNIMNDEDINQKIRAGKNYCLISDFVCLGTEVKIINTIISCCKANLLGGVTVASYIDPKLSEYKDSVVSKIYTLMNTHEFGFDYKLSAYSKDLLGGKNENN